MFIKTRKIHHLKDFIIVGIGNHAICIVVVYNIYILIAWNNHKIGISNSRISNVGIQNKAILVVFISNTRIFIMRISSKGNLYFWNQQQLYVQCGDPQ